jgi:hypothetical protein
LGRARFYSTDPSPPGQLAHWPFLPCVHALGRCKADRAAPCHVLLPASTRSPCNTASTSVALVTLICCLNVEGRNQASFRPTSIPPRSAPMSLLLCALRRPSSHRLPRRRVLFSAMPVTIRERPAVNPSRPQASTPTGLKPTSSAFHCEHLNAASRPSGLTSPPRASPRPHTPHWPTIHANGHQATPLIGAPTRPMHTTMQRPVR